ncbi:transglycosylase domain-containing protein [Pseudofulvibacter geojedonensis]|uniref:Transglycosylase domain-containing protein n=1 Tax=Pseudofulvibacter geojedonensis TaxID=1123758 RepID=A0ABW3I239_9FLAO
MIKKILRFLLKLSLFIAFIVAAFITAVNYDVFGHIYTKDELKDFNNEEASIVLSESNSVIGKYFQENRTNTSFNQLPKHLINALVATEDARYFEHSGVDTRSLFRVLFKSILQNNKRSGGGSTITQQLAKNMYGRKDYGPLTMLINKTKEGIQAYRIEQTFTKKDILTLYLNTVSFGENVYGIEAAALRYFNKSVSNLKLEEAAVLVGILKANTYYNPRLYPQNAIKRRKVVLVQMEKYGYLTQQELDSIQKIPLKLEYNNLNSENNTGYFLTEVKKEAQNIIKKINEEKNTNYQIETDGLQIHTTLDINLQNAALQSFQSHLKTMQNLIRKQYKNSNTLRKHIDNILKKESLYDKKFEKKKQLVFDWKETYLDSISIYDSIQKSETLLHAGLLAMNPKNGQIKAWVGGIDHSMYPYDQIYAQRQVASTFKPILYAAALEENISPCDYLENEELIISDYDNWSPENANKKLGGKYSMAGALKNSLNIPTVNLFMKTGFKPVDTLWKKMEFSSNIKNTPSLALGTATASIFELTKAYGAFANNGELVQPYFITQITTGDGKIIYKHQAKNKNNIIKENTAEIINYILQKAINEGTGTALRSKYGVKLPLAGKTGSSQNYADAWFASYNPDLIMVSRVGCSSPKIHFNNGNGSGGRLALPLVAKTLKKVQHQKKYHTSFKPLSDEQLESLNCDDYKEKTGLEKFFDIFKKKDKNFEKEQQKADKKNNESIFKKIFKKKKD